MDHDLMVERLFESLITGDRQGTRQLVSEFTGQGTTPRQLINDLFWPTYNLIERLHREDQLTRMSYQMATRLLRATVDRITAQLPLAPRSGKSVFACCGPTEGDELGAQMATDLLEAAGFTVTFAGGQLPSDEILAQVHEARPDTLLIFAAGPSDLPGVRGLIDTIREIAAVPHMKIAVGGGVFNRAAGLADEIGVHIYASTPMEMVDVLINPPAQRIIEERPVATKRRVRRAA